MIVYYIWYLKGTYIWYLKGTYIWARNAFLKKTRRMTFFIFYCGPDTAHLYEQKLAPFPLFHFPWICKFKESEILR